MIVSVRRGELMLVYDRKNMKCAYMLDDLRQIIYLKNAIDVREDGEVLWARWYMPYPGSHHLAPWEKPNERL